MQTIELSMSMPFVDDDPLPTATHGHESHCHHLHPAYTSLSHIQALKPGYRLADTRCKRETLRLDIHSFDQTLLN